MPLAVLDTVGQSLTIAGSSASVVASTYGVVWHDETPGEPDYHGSSGILTGTTPVTVVSFPASAFARRVVDLISVSNQDGATYAYYVSEAASSKRIAEVAIPSAKGHVFGDLTAPIAVLDTTTKSLAVKLATAASVTQPDFIAVWRESGDRHSTLGTFNDTTEVAALAAPGSSYARRICESVYVDNKSNTEETAILILKDSAGTDREIARVTMQVNMTGAFPASAVISTHTHPVSDLTFSGTNLLAGRSSAGAGVGEEITCTAAGRALIDDANAAAQRTTLGLGSIATQDANAVAITGGSITGITDLAVADGGTGASDAATARTNLGLVIGTNVQAYDADLTTWAGITPGTGVGTALAVNVGTAGAVVVNGGALGTPASGTLTNATGLPASGVVGTALVSADIGVTVQGYDADLNTIAGLTATSGNFLQAASSAWASRTPTQAAVDLQKVIVQPAARVSSPQNSDDGGIELDNNEFEILQWTAEDIDNFSLFSPTDIEFIVPSGQGGVYWVYCEVTWEASGANVRGLFIYVNDSQVSLTNYQDGGSNSNPQQVGQLLSLSAADEVEVRAYQNSGAGLDITYGKFQIFKVST